MDFLKGKYLRGIEILWDEMEEENNYPFNLPVFRNLHQLEFNSDVTFIIGENGSGKSTLLEALAVAWGFNPEGGSRNFNFNTRESHSDLFRHMRIIKGISKARDGFFFRAESFFNVATEVDNLRVTDRYGGHSLHEQSNGESFMATFINRFYGQGLYILDEPEAALSPSRQMAMLSIIHDLVKDGSQFIIATHSPIIMAYPNAKILLVEANGLAEAEYEQTEHYTVMREFINNRKKLLEILLDSQQGCK